MGNNLRWFGGGSLRRTMTIQLFEKLERIIGSYIITAAFLEEGSRIQQVLNGHPKEQN